MTLELESAKVHKGFYEYKLKPERGECSRKEKEKIFISFFLTNNTRLATQTSIAKYLPAAVKYVLSSRLPESPQVHIVLALDIVAAMISNGCH